MRSFFRSNLLRELGLSTCPPFYRDRYFGLALLAGVAVCIAFRLWLPEKAAFALIPFLSIVLWQPLVEELLFRGVLQGQLRQFEWGRRRWWEISGANLLTSLVFVGIHFINQPPLWALAVFVPSLLFGYARERYRSLYPAFALHGLYNLMYVWSRLG